MGERLKNWCKLIGESLSGAAVSRLEVLVVLILPAGDELLSLNVYLTCPTRYKSFYKVRQVNFLFSKYNKTHVMYQKLLIFFFVM